MRAGEGSLDGKALIVTGAGGAIAGAIVEVLAAAGARLALVELHASDRVTARAAAVPAGGLVVTADLSRYDAAEAMAGATRERFGRVDGLVHTVGGFAMGPLSEADPALYDRMFDANVRTLVYATRAVLPGLLAQRDGFLAGISADPGWSGASPNAAIYGAAKAAVAAFLRSVDGELGGTEIRTAIVYPTAAVDTPANRRDMPDVDPARFIDPRAIGEALLFAATRGPRGRMSEFPIFAPRAASPVTK